MRDIEKNNFAWFAAAMAPTANLGCLRVITDWGNWIFPFDDLFDNGELRRNIGRAKPLMNGILRTMEDGYDGKLGYVEDIGGFDVWIQFHYQVWQALRKESP
ncbi:hypothetical protein LTR56_027632, partial [Elasticomyces elasticus]